MDQATLEVYDSNAALYCDEWLQQPAPEDIRMLWRRFFCEGAATADIGSGSGRDVDWLNRNGYPCIGFEPSAALRAEARMRFPQWQYAHAALPALSELGQAMFANIVCETVLMHLPLAEVRPAARALARALAPGGTLYLSWRVTEGAAGLRDGAGRLYSAFAAGTVRDELDDMALLYDAEELSASSGKRVHRLIARRPP